MKGKANEGSGARCSAVQCSAVEGGWSGGVGTHNLRVHPDGGTQEVKVLLMWPSCHSQVACEHIELPSRPPPSYPLFPQSSLSESKHTDHYYDYCTNPWFPGDSLECFQSRKYLLILLLFFFCLHLHHHHRRCILFPSYMEACVCVCVCVCISAAWPL